MRPRGVDPQKAGDKESGEPSAKQLAKIKRYRENAQKVFYLTDPHLARKEYWLLSKQRFLMDEQNAHSITADQLIYLLGDWNTLFNRRFQDYAHDKPFYDAWKSEIGETAEDVRAYLITEALVKVDDPELRKRYTFVLTAMQAAADQEEGAAGCVPELSMLRGEEREAFFADVLQNYLARQRELPAIWKAAGRYHPGLSAEEAEAANADMGRVERLRRLIKVYDEWNPAQFNVRNLTNGCEYQSNMYTGEEGCELLSAKQISNIVTVTKRFFNLVKPRSTAEVQDGLTRAVILHILLGDKGSEERRRTPRQSLMGFPFVFLMVCATDRELFTKKTTIHYDKFADRCSAAGHVYDERPSKARQRSARIELLRELLTICDLSPEERLLNWNMFLSVHGLEILSPEEFQLWREITQKLPERMPIELEVCASECLGVCIPALPEELSSYHAGSVLHLGGAMKYLRDHPDVLPRLVECFPRRDDYWVDVEKRYFDAAFSFDYGSEKIKDGLLQLSNRAIFNWEEIPGASHRDMVEFCESLYQGEAQPERVESNVKELRSLLVETALRKDAEKRTRKVISDAFDKCFGLTLYDYTK